MMDMPHVLVGFDDSQPPGGRCAGRRLADHPDFAVEQRFVLERAQRALADNAWDAILLVVGDHGIGSSPRTLLGAVTRAVLHEAPCPVAVVHERDPNAKESS